MGPTPSGIDRARPEDVLQLAVDGGRVPMAIGALLVLDGANRPPADVVRRAVLERSAGIRRLGQRLVGAPFGSGRPVWLDAGPDLLDGLVDEQRVERTTGNGGVTEAEAPASEDETVSRSLLDATADLVLTHLPRDRPLWRARLLLDRGGAVCGVALVAHHALADGMGGLAVLAALADGRPVGTGHAAWPEQVLPPWHALARDAWSERLEVFREARGARRRVGGGVEELGLRRPRLAEACSLLGHTSDRRRLDVARAGLDGVRRAAHQHGATVNDIAVTAVTGALVAMLERRGERVGEIVVSVPVSLRPQHSAGALGNSTGVVPVRVPAVPDPDVRLEALVAQEGRIRSSGRGASAAVLTPLFRGLAAVGAFQPFIDHQRLVHTFVTNVRGPGERFRLTGSDVLAVVPVATHPGDVTVSFDVMSYAGTLGITLVSDPLCVPEAPWLARTVEKQLLSLS